MEELKAIFKEIKSYDNNISADMAIDCATRIFNSRNINEVKAAEPSEPATSKQKFFLKKNGYEGNLDNLTKTEAIELIKEMKGG